MKQSGTAQRAWSGRWPVWLVVHERLPRGAIAPLRNLPFALFVLGILGYGAAFAWHVLDRFDLVNLLQHMSYDDAFYYFQIAYHMAEGRFSTFDGGVTRTNGYHPLWLFLITPIYWVFDKTEALFAVKAFEIMLVAGGVALVAVAARVARLPWILLFAVLPALYVQRGMLWGLEAALVLFMLGALVLAASLFARDPARWRWLLAAVVFALPWARLECAAVAVAATVALGFLEWTGRLPGAPAAAPGGVCAGLPSFRLLRLHAAVPLAGAFAGMLVYFAYNGIVFGGMVPVSGAVKALWSQSKWEHAGGYDLVENFKAFAQLEVFDGELLTAFEVCFYALLVWWLARGSRSRGDALLLAFAAGVAGLAAGHLAKFAQNVFFVHPALGDFAWYYVPAYLMEALVVPLRCCVGIYLVRRFVAPRLPRASDVLCLAAVAAAGVVLLAKVDFAEPFRAIDDRAKDSHGESWLFAGTSGVLVMDRLLPKDTLVGSWDAGVIGYFSRLPVVNLDGLVNSYDHKEALEEGWAGAFWWRHGISHFANAFVGEWSAGARSTSVWEEMEVPSPFAGIVSDARTRTARVWEEQVSFEPSGPSLRGTTASRLGFDLRAEDGHLVYAKAPCTDDDVAPRFFLHVFAVSEDELPDHRKQFGFANLDFWFKDYGTVLDGACLARVPLPEYEIARVSTGQIVDVEVLFKAARGSRLRFGGPQFKLYRHSSGSKSSPIDRAAWLREKMAPHLEPQADGIGLLVEGRTAQAFAWDCTADANEVAEWAFGGEVGAVTDWTQTADGVCASALVLPHERPGPVRVRRAALAEAVSGLAGDRPPAIRADSTPAADATHPAGFDVYLAEDTLVYAKAACERADVETPFFLHVVPAGDDFDDGRESVGFNNLDFMLEQHGDWFGEEGETAPCLAEIPLPEYAVAAVSTGQFSAQRRLWAGTVPLDIERSADGVGLALAGGHALAFAMDCAVDEVALWSFGLEGLEAQAISTWTRTADGSCRSDVALQHGHPSPARVRRAALDEALAQRTGGLAPAIRADSGSRGFDVYLAEGLAQGALVYAKEACEGTDVETPFFLHFVPAGENFDEGRKSVGYNNADFAFARHGVWSGDDGSPCLAEVPLPPYPIAEIRTGQYAAEDFRRVWEGEIGRGQLTAEGA